MLVTGCSTTPQREHRLQAEQNLNRMRAGVKHQIADQALQAGRIDEATAALQEAVKLDPNIAEQHRTLARCYLEQGRIGEAAAEAAEADRLGDLSAEQAYVNGMIAQRRERTDEALQHYAAARKRDPANVNYLLAEIEVLVTAGQAAQARTLIDRHLEDLDRDPRLVLMRADIAVISGDWRQAAADFAAAGPLTRETPWHAEQYGLVLARLGRFAEAASILEPLVENERKADDEPSRDPERDQGGSVKPRMTRSGVRGEGAVFGLETGPLPYARGSDKSWHAPSESSPGGAAVRALATCYMNTRQHGRAEQLLRQHVVDHPNDATAWRLLGEIALTKLDWRAAERYAQAGMAAAPGRVDWDLIRAFAAWKSGEPSGAKTILDDTLTRHPDNVEVLCLLGEIYESGNERPTARTYFESALRIAPQCPWALSRLSAPQ